MKKKYLVLLLIIISVLFTTGCFRSLISKAIAPQETTAGQGPVTVQTTTEQQPKPTTTATTTTSSKPTTMQVESIKTSQTVQQARHETTFADMLAYDPDTGLANFDCFNMLQGKEAIAWLIDNKGYTKAQAEAEVDQYADSEYIEDRPDRQLLDVALDAVELSLLYEPDGELLLQQVSYDLPAFNEFFEEHPDAVLHSFFYELTIEEGVVVAIHQYYWP